MKCPVCSGAMKPLFTSWFCPACDERKAKYEAAFKEVQAARIDTDKARELIAKPRIWVSAPAPAGPSAYGPPVAPPPPATALYFRDVFLAPGFQVQWTGCVQSVIWRSTVRCLDECPARCSGRIALLNLQANMGACTRDGYMGPAVHDWAWEER